MGQPATPKGTWARLLNQGTRSLARARDLHFCARIPAVAVSGSSGLPLLVHMSLAERVSNPNPEFGSDY
jgi:hypothetical protein